MTKTCLGSIAEIITGPFGSALHQYEYVDKGVPVIMPQDIENRNVSYENIAYITLQKAEELSRYIVIKNDIVYARRGDIEKHAFITSSTNGAICGTGCLRVRVIDTSVNPLFLSYYLDKPETRKWIVSHAVGSNMPNLNTDILSDVPVELPSKEEQDRIVLILKRIENQIANNTAICSDLEAMAKLLYDYWFVQFDFPDENGKPYKSSGEKMVWNEQLKREIPEGWAKKEVSAIANIIANSITPRSDIEYRHYSIPAFDEKGMPLEESGANINSNKYLVPENAILVSKLNPQFKRIWVISDSDDRSICSTEFIPFVSIEGHRDYLYSLLNSDAFHTYMVQCSSSSTGSRTRMDPELCLRFAFASPKDNALIERYCKTVAPMLSKIEELKDENQQLTSLRDFLLPMLMNGQVRV